MTRIGEVGMAAPIFADDSPRRARIVRRVRGITLESAGFVLVTVLFPVLLVIAALVDLALWIASRKPWMATRLLAVLWWFLFTEMRAYAVLLWLTVRNRGDTEARRKGVYELRIRWCRRHLGMMRTVLGLSFEIEGLDRVGPAPVNILVRHASIIDNMLPDAVAASAHGIGLRYVIKRELQMIPLIDIAGRWVPTIFVRRASGDPAAEITVLRTLTEDIGAGEGFLVYPEGTRFTEKKLARAKEVIAERQPELAERANRFEHLLPPRLGGTLALLEETPDLDVVVCGHVGFDGFQYISNIWAGGLVGTTIRVRFERFAAETIPGDAQGRTDWLYERWLELDRWIGEQTTR